MSLISQSERDEWEAAFKAMVRGVVHEHIMWQVAHALEPLLETLENIERDVTMISQIAGRMSPVPATTAEQRPTSAPALLLRYNSSYQ